MELADVRRVASVYLTAGLRVQRRFWARLDALCQGARVGRGDLLRAVLLAGLQAVERYPAQIPRLIAEARDG